MAERKQQARLIQPALPTGGKARHFTVTCGSDVRLLKAMAALVRVRHVGFKTCLFATQNTFATKAEKKKGIDRKVGPKIDSSAASLAAKGFLRHQKEYTPPTNLNSKLHDIYEKILGTADENTTMKDLNQRFVLFSECSKAFDRTIPNSQLHEIKTLGDVSRFYATAVETITPLDRLKTIELPANLHVQYEYHRFHPDTDTKFGGVTAFPERSTVVTGLKYKDKYKGHSQKIKHPEF